MKTGDDLIELLQLERKLEQQFQNVNLIGQLQVERDDLEQVIQSAVNLLNGQRINIGRIPNKVFLFLMVFCARFEDTSEKGFWDAFLHKLGLAFDPNIQNVCRERFRQARDSVSDLYFPDEGYACVTPVLYHAVVPQVCVPDMVKLIRRLNKEPGWDVIANLGMEELVKLLPETVERLHTSKPLKRFVQKEYSKRIAVDFVHGICESAYLWQEGELRSEEINQLLQDHPVQKEIWDHLQERDDDQTQDTVARSSFAQPRWLWDISRRQAQLYFSKQYVVGFRRPAYYKVDTKTYAVHSSCSDERWIVSSIALSNLPIAPQNNSRVSVDLYGDDGASLHRWTVKFPREDFLFFQVNCQISSGRVISAEDGLPAGSYALLYRHGLQLQCSDTKERLTPIQRLFPPQGWQTYDAGLFEIASPIEIVDETGEAVFTAKASTDSPGKIRFVDGAQLREASNPEDVPVFMEQSPDLAITLKRRAELDSLQVQIRSLLQKQAYTITKPIRELLGCDEASWSEDKSELTIKLRKLLAGKNQGHFRIRLMQGLISARYTPIEFILVPAIEISSPDTLFTKERLPEVILKSHDIKHIDSEYGKVEVIADHEYRIVWSITAAQFDAIIAFDHISLSMRWLLNVLRACVISHDAMALEWSEEVPALPQQEMTFAKKLSVQGYPESKYEICHGDSIFKRGKFESDAFIQFALAELSDYVRHTSSNDITLFLRTYVDNAEYQLNLFRVFNNPKIDDFQWVICENTLLVSGRAYGQSEGTLELVLVDLLRPWQNTFKLSLPPSTFSKANATYEVVLPCSFQPSFYRLEMQLRHSEGITKFIEDDDQPLIRPFLDFGFSNILEDGNVESTNLTSEQLFMLAIAATEPRNKISKQTGELLWRKVAEIEESIELAARGLTNLALANELAPWSAKTHLLKSFQTADLIAPMLKEIMRYPARESRYVLSRLFDAGLNFTDIGFDELEEVFRNASNSKLDTLSLWELWLPLGAIFELNDHDHAKGDYYWVDKLGHSPLHLSERMVVSLTKSPSRDRKNKSRPFHVEITAFDEKSGETTGRCIKGFADKCADGKAHWQYPLDGQDEFEVWFEIKRNGETQFAWYCTCETILISEDENHNHPADFGRSMARPITPEMPIKMQMQRIELQKIDLNRMMDLGFLNRLAIGIHDQNEHSKTDSIAHARLAGYYPVFDRRFFRKACAQWYQNYQSREFPERKKAVDELVAESLVEKLNGAIKRLVIGDEIMPALLSVQAGQLLKKCYLECSKHHHNAVPFSKLYTINLAVAALNRLRVHEPVKCEQAMSETGLTRRDLAIASANARRGCRLLFDHALCLVESILVWYRK